MTTPPPAPPLFIKKVRGMGRGVFAGKRFEAGGVVEVCPVIALPTGADEAGMSGGLAHYVFRWGRADEGLAVALGYGSLYNHSKTPNAAFQPRFSTGDIVFRALRAIEPGEQIFVDYQWDEEDYAVFRKPAKKAAAGG